MCVSTPTILIGSTDHRWAAGSGSSCSGCCHGNIVPAPFLQPIYHSLALMGWDRKLFHLQALISTSWPRNPLVFQLITFQFPILALHWRRPPTHSERGGGDPLAGHTLWCSRGLWLEKGRAGQLSLGKNQERRAKKSDRGEIYKQADRNKDKKGNNKKLK